MRYDLSSNAQMRDAYADSRGDILIGKLLEDLDAFAANIASMHCVSDDKDAPLTFNLVTASVDEIKLERVRRLPATEDYVLVGQCVWVGRSSLDVLIEVHRARDIPPGGNPVLIEETNSRVLSSFFTFAARDARTGKAAPVNRLKASTPAESDILAQRAIIAADKKKRDVCLIKDGRNVENQIDILVDRGSALLDMPALAHPSSVLMKSTMMENTLICQPQNVNPSGRVFGGFLMHRAYDLAQATCYTFAGQYPRFRGVEEVAFKKPVDIGDLVRLKSKVVYSSDDPVDPIVHIEVTCQVVRPERASSFVSNTFDFIMGFIGESVNLRRVLPTTREEAERQLLALASKEASWRSN